MSAPSITLDFQIRPHPAPIPAERRAELIADPRFGQIFTDHMVTVRYRHGQGWYDARLEPYGPLPLSPATAALHYGQCVFEGLKAYRTPGGGASTFRPLDNARRLRASADRLAMPAVPDELFLGALRVLVEHDRQWLPGRPGSSLYLRPLLFASEEFLGVRLANEYLFVVMASPAGAYFSGGIRPLKLWASERYTRAAPGGTGAAKCAGNYGAGYAAQVEAIEAGCDQVLYLDARQHRYIDEAGTMNVFAIYGQGDDTMLVTPPLTGTILPGITRDSVLALARRHGYRIQERPYALAEWQADAGSGRLRESFACGTAAVVAPIGTVCGAHGEFTIGDGTEGPVTAGLRRELLDIQYGRADDPFGWRHRLF